MDENCWSRKYRRGPVEDPSYHPPEEIHFWTVTGSPRQNRKRLRYVFPGIPVALNGKNLPGYDLIQALNILAGRHGVGRNDMIEDRILGLKARENYEHPGSDGDPCCPP